jgi:hypothetical protein
MRPSFHARARLRGARLTAALLALAALCSGCAATAVKPWDRDLLAEKKMRYGALPIENAVDEHIYFSKEGSTGGSDVGGGGCGCN